MRRRWIAWAGAAVGAILLAGAVTLLIVNGTLSDDPFTGLSILMMVAYVAVGAILCTRPPSNPIGWLLLARGTGLQGMADRLDAIGGELRIRSAPGEGATVGGVVPLTVSVGRPPSRPIPVIERSGA